MAEKLKLTATQKAAAILVAMGKPSAGRLLKFFKQEELKSLIEAARVLRTIPQADLERIVAEFEDEFAEGAGLLDSADSMDTILSESLSPEEINILMGRTDASATGNQSVWNELEKLDLQRIGELMAAEHPQTVALVMSNIAAQTAANVLVLLPKEQRGEVVKRMAMMGGTTPAARQMLEARLRSHLRAEAGGSDASASQDRVAGILNELDKEQIDEMMSDLQAAGSNDVAAIRSRLFSFEDLVLLPQKARVALFDGLPTDVVTLSLRNATPDLVEAVLSALGARSRRMIESELSEGSEGIPLDDIARARRRIASTAVRLSQQGLFALPSAEQAA